MISATQWPRYAPSVEQSGRSHLPARLKQYYFVQTPGTVVRVLRVLQYHFTTTDQVKPGKY